MSRVLFTSVGATLLATALGMPALAQQQAPAPQQQQRPPQETTKVEGTDNVYIFRNGNHQAMFIVTKDGVIATDPVAYGKPQGGQQYVDAIKKVTGQADQIPDLQPPSQRSHRRRQGVQGRRGQGDRAQERHRRGSTC